MRAMPFPIHRPRRLRSSEQIRSLVRETRLAPTQFILPLFVCPGEGVRREIGSMPGNYQLSIDQLVLECKEVLALGVGGVILFGLPETKDEEASGGYAEDGIVQRAIRALKAALLIAQVAKIDRDANETDEDQEAYCRKNGRLATLFTNEAAQYPLFLLHVHRTSLTNGESYGFSNSQLSARPHSHADRSS